ncbi:GumC family protein [Sphingomonas nostoxanthinifaciens]|uniref:GumC family protein n=1 Tax=Sphingomonas nostoxanthinifaciens TaxID=2872652 RepID=UPI001CC218F4|nr:Wzz/FepE/Etk N-terminal domain-containing protein [Sphingomonas nostoxanthinifaciens]UAK24142.1 lipopolysaccharide biosynthesis protein [Sphingomonas nostoxanthinifaciens]
MTPTTEEEELQPGTGFLASLPNVFWERRWLIILPAILTTIAGITAAYMIHPIYESSATVLIEQQQLPDSVIGQRDQGDTIGPRVARARERVLSRMDLIRLIRTYNLYPTAQKNMPLSRVVDLMRASTTIAAVDTSINIGTTRQSVPGDTVAISVAFDYDDPEKAQIVAQQFVNRLLDVDASSQASQAADAVNFLTEQANGVQTQINAVQDQINRIKTENGPAFAFAQSTGDPVADLSRIDADIAGIQAENARLPSMTSRESDDTGVAAAEAALRVAQAKFSDSHPDVLAARAQLDAAKHAASAAPKGADPIAAQLAANRARLAALQSARAMIASHSSSADAQRSRAPILMEQVSQLEKQADSLRSRNELIGTRLQAAQIQARVETEQKGERLTLADPPVVPDHPIKPNRPLLIAGSIIGGLGFGAALILLIELVLRPIRGTLALREALGAAPLAIVPDFDRKQHWIARLIERRTRRKTPARA